jgi:GNAT superfamily N-acetyltransferase
VTSNPAPSGIMLPLCQKSRLCHNIGPMPYFWQVDLKIFTVAERPELARRRRELDAEWPRFLHYDPTGLFFHLDAYAEHTLFGVIDAEPDMLVARASSVPFRLGDAELPDDGLDEVVRWAAHGRLVGAVPDTVATVEVVVRRDAQRRGLGARMLEALRDNARRLGFDTLVAPVRPILKHEEPRVRIAEYAARTRPDGLPWDPWLRAHARLGASVAKVAPYSTVIPGTLQQWREWTGLPFDRSGETVVPGALVPVVASVEHDYAVYVEPNVWMRHAVG